MKVTHPRQTMNSQVASSEPPSYAEATGRSQPLDHPSSSLADNDKNDATTTKEAACVENEGIAQQSQPYHSTSLPSQYLALKFTIHVEKSLLPNRTIIIEPVAPLSPSVFGKTSMWQLRYTSNTTASVRRHAQSLHDRLVRHEIASVHFPEDTWPSSGPRIRFRPHEDAVSRSKERCTSDTYVCMRRTGFLTTRYQAELPEGLGREKVVWQVDDGEARSMLKQRDGFRKRSDAMSGRSEKAAQDPPDTETEMSVPSLTEPRPGREDCGTLSPPQVLTNSDGEVWATFARTALNSDVLGWLTIHHIPDSSKTEHSAAEFVEAIIVLCTAMVGMQRRHGLAAMVIGRLDNLRFSKGKKKAPDTADTGSSCN